MPRVRTVAVTGGMGAGKSTVARMLAELGAEVVDSDAVARAVVEPGTPGLAAVVHAFGAGVLAEDGSLDRAVLAEIIFADEAARTRLEGIIHPLVRAEFGRRRDAAAPDTVVVNDIPLLRDANEAAAFDRVVTVTADTDLRVQRLAGRGVAEDDARARIAAQPSDEDRAPFTDHWIVNDGDADHLRAQVGRLWRDHLDPRPHT